MSYTYDVIYANNPQSTLSGSITPTDTSARLASGTGVLFPVLGANQAFTLTFTDSATGLINEIVLVTDFDNATDTINSMLRGQENTTARSWSSGDLANNLITADYLNGLLQEEQALNGYLPVAGGTMTGQINFAQPITLASASTVNIGNALSNNIVITGTTTINSFGTITSGATRNITFSGSLTLTYNATSMILPNNGENIVTSAGDSALFLSLGSGNWKCISYTQVNGKALQYTPQIQSDYTQTDTNALDYIKNKPDLAAVATSGSYNDLSNKPTIPANSQVFSPSAIWNDVTGSRSISVTYTNTREYPIVILVQCVNTNGIYIYINGNLVIRNWADVNTGAGQVGYSSANVIIPPQSTYHVTNGTKVTWLELY